MGTVGYMSPEQAAGSAVDFRSDQFSFGSILYEMATGKRAFERATTPEILAAIIREEPEPISERNSGRPPRALDRRALPRQGAEGSLRHDRGSRARSRDAARAPLGALGRDASLARAPTALGEMGNGRSGGCAAGDARRDVLARPACRAVAHLPAALPRQLTFGSAGISTARFAPGGQTVVYTAQFEGKPPELLTARLDSPETRSLGLSRAEILSVSSSGQMALLIAPRFGVLSRCHTRTCRSIRLCSGECSPRRRSPGARRASSSRTRTSRTGARTANRSPSCAMPEA